jgi:threonine dehydratase
MQPPQNALEAMRLGARLLPVRNNFLATCHRQTQKYVEAQGGWMLPLGGELEQGIEAIAAEAASLPRWMVEGGTIIVPCGSGVTLSGVARGLVANPSRIIGVSSGRSADAIRRCLIRNHVGELTNIEIRAPDRAYRKPDNISAPFPCDAYYDLKAWRVLMSEIRTYKEPILFWNVGG